MMDEPTPSTSNSESTSEERRPICFVNVESKVPGEFDDDEPQGKKMCTKDRISMYNLARLIRELGTREQGMAFAEDHGLILKTKICSNHRHPMKIRRSKGLLGEFYCSKRTCIGKMTRGRGIGTFFEHNKKSLLHTYYLMYCYAHNWSYDTAIWEDPLKDQLKKCLMWSTVKSYYSYLREAVVSYQIDKQQFIGKIGGPGKVVQVDENRFKKRQHSKGKHIDDQYVLGLIEDGSEDLRLEVVSERTSEVLMGLIKKHVEPGTTVHTDSSEIFDSLSEHGFYHKRIDHTDRENRFVAEDGTNTQRIGSTWRVVKNFFYKKNNAPTEDFSDLIVEYMWRRTVKKNNADPFLELVKVIRHVYKPS